MSMLRGRLSLGLGMLALLVSSSVFAQNKIVVGGSDNLKLSVYGVWSELIYKDAFQRLGYEFEYLGFPAARVEYVFEQGKLDGEINRIASYNDRRPDLIRVSEYHFEMNSVAYSQIKGLKLDNWETFSSTPYKVEYRNGSKLFESQVVPRMRDGTLTKVTTTEQGVKRLILGRTDIFLELDLSVEDVLAKLDPQLYNTQRIHMAGVLARKPSYLFLHKKHHALARSLARTLQDMKREGVIEQYRLQAISLHH